MGRPGALKQKPVRKHHPGGGKDLKSPAASCMSWRRASLISEAPEAHDAHARSSKDFLSIWSILKPKSGKKQSVLFLKKIEELFRINGHLRIQRNPQVAYNLGLTWEKVQKCLLQQVSWSSHPISPTKRSPLAVPLGKAVGESWDFCSQTHAPLQVTYSFISSSGIQWCAFFPSKLLLVLWYVRKRST